jgi:divalent metal cation (Fe/Co/Zn/Cd) transporter
MAPIQKLTFHICLPDDILLGNANKIVHKLEENIKTQTGYETTIHIDTKKGGTKPPKDSITLT